ncbi:MAG: hypothetical protein K1X65_11845 [Caldilineales bacterium]|nr:hypothetical protein [Caldilineales bacterium]MCW5860783.1 hypothetical protein [Caldilineales bacterium]
MPVKDPYSVPAPGGSATAWLIMVNGFIVDAHTLPREGQEIGLILYCADDR